MEEEHASPEADNTAHTPSKTPYSVSWWGTSRNVSGTNTVIAFAEFLIKGQDEPVAECTVSAIPSIGSKLYLVGIPGHDPGVWKVVDVEWYIDIQQREKYPGQMERISITIKKK